MAGLRGDPAPAYISPPRQTREDKARSDRYRAEDDIRTLQRAQEVQQDPGRMRMAQRIAREQAAALAKITKRK